MLTFSCPGCKCDVAVVPAIVTPPPPQKFIIHRLPWTLRNCSVRHGEHLLWMVGANALPHLDCFTPKVEGNFGCGFIKIQYNDLLGTLYDTTPSIKGLECEWEHLYRRVYAIFYFVREDEEDFSTDNVYKYCVMIRVGDRYQQENRRLITKYNNEFNGKFVIDEDMIQWMLKSART